MSPLRKTTTMAMLAALAAACDPATHPLAGPVGDVVADVQPEWSAWTTPVNLGPVVNSTANDQHPSISKDGLSLYFISNRLGGY